MQMQPWLSQPLPGDRGGYIDIVMNIFGRILYTAHGAQVPLPLIFVFVFFLFLCLFLFRLGQVKVIFAPQDKERGLVKATQGQSPLQRLELEKNVRGGGICASCTKHRKVLFILVTRYIYIRSQKNVLCLYIQFPWYWNKFT